jgi:hypothetical protein
MGTRFSCPPDNASRLSREDVEGKRPDVFFFCDLASREVYRISSK